MQSVFIIMLLTALILAMASKPAGAWEQDQFIITAWCPPPPTEKALKAYAAEGFNLLTSTTLEGLDIAAKHGLRALLGDPLLNPDSLDNPVKKKALAALIKRVKNHPALEGYYLVDEPGAGAFPGLGRLVAFLRQRDAKHFAYINLFPTYANAAQLGVSADAAARKRVGIPLNFAGVGDHRQTILNYKKHLRDFLDIVKPELISYDHYHFLRKSDGAQYFLNLALIKEAARSAGRPFLNIIQASTIEPSWRLVNKHELRWLVYTTLAYGGRGLSYFLYWGPKSYGGLYQDGARTPLALDVAALNGELKTLGPEIMKLKSSGVYHTGTLPVGTIAVPSTSPVQFAGTGDFVLGLFATEKQTDAFMLVNRNYKQPSTAHILLRKTCRALQEFDRKSGAWQLYCPVSPGKPVAIKLEKGDGRLFRMSGK